MLVESNGFMEQNSVGDVCGFDLSMLNTFSTETYFPVRERLHDCEALSERSLLRRYEYLSSIPAPTIGLDVGMDGLLTGVLTWMEIQFGEHVFSNEPGAPSHWHKAFHPLARPIRVSAGQVIEVTIDDDGRAICDLVESSARPRSGSGAS